MSTQLTPAQVVALLLQAKADALTGYNAIAAAGPSAWYTTISSVVATIGGQPVVTAADAVGQLKNGLDLLNAQITAAVNYIQSGMQQDQGARLGLIMHDTNNMITGFNGDCVRVAGVINDASTAGIIKNAATDSGNAIGSALSATANLAGQALLNFVKAAIVAVATKTTATGWAFVALSFLGMFLLFRAKQKVDSVIP